MGKDDPRIPAACSTGTVRLYLMRLHLEDEVANTPECEVDRGGSGSV